MYRLLDLQNCSNDFIINAQEPSALLDTEAYAVSAITPDGRLVFCNRAFLVRYYFDRQYGFRTSIKELLPELKNLVEQLMITSEELVYS